MTDVPVLQEMQLRAHDTQRIYGGVGEVVWLLQRLSFMPEFLEQVPLYILCRTEGHRLKVRLVRTKTHGNGVIFLQLCPG